MATVIIPERFNGQYNATIPPTLLQPGWISDGKNVRKVSQQGGWKPRRGCSLHNTTVIESGVGPKSLHYYENPFNGDEHFIAQANSKLLIETAQDKLPPVVDVSYGTSLGVAVGATPGFSATVGEYFFYADGSGRPIAYGGASPRVKGFFSYDISETSYNDYSRVVADGRVDTEAIMVGAVTDVAYVVTEERASAFVFNLGGTVNAELATLTIKAWRSGALTAVSGLSDGTASGGATMAVDGTVSWTASALDEMRAFYGVEGYVYQLSWDIALTGSVDVISINATQAVALMTNKWNGEMDWVIGARFYDQSAGEYQECLGKVTNESTSMYIDISSATTSDFLYIKTPEPVGVFGIAIATGYANIDAALIDQIDYWDGDSWTGITTNLADLTLDTAADSSFSQTGTLQFDASAITPRRRIFQGDNIPGYWYRISWAVALSADVRIYALLYGAFPETLPIYDGCVEFKGRLLVWGDPEFPNRLRFSARRNPFCFSGADSGYTDPFGAEDKILCAIKFYNELIVFKEKSVWLLEGDSPATFGTLKITDKVGLASPKSAVVAEVGFPDIHREEPMTIAIWQDVDGVYTFDGRKTKKESLPVDNYFNPEKSDCIAAADITSLQAFVDRTNNEYHLLLPAGELVFNYITAEWYPPWERKIPLRTGVDFRANDNRQYVYGGSSSGWVMRLETDTSDKTIANADEPINHSVKTRAVGYQAGERLVRFTLRRILAELKARSSGDVVVKSFKDLATSGTIQDTPQAMSMVNSGFNMTVPHVATSIEDCACFQIEFSLDVIDEEMEIYSFYYEIAGSGISED